MPPPARIGPFEVVEDLGDARFVVQHDGEERLLRVFEGAPGPALLRIASITPHPHLVTVHGLHPLDERTAVEIERVDGPTLDAWLRTEANLDVRERVLRQVAAALAHAHARGFGHGHLTASHVQLELRSTGPFARVHWELEQMGERGDDVRAVAGLLANMIEGQDEVEPRYRHAVAAETSSITDWLRVLDGDVEDTSPPTYAEWLAEDSSEDGGVTVAEPLLLDPIGRDLWRGTWRGRTAAIRKVPAHHDEDNLDRQRRILGRLRRHCFPVLVDDFDGNGSRWLVREWVEGATVASWLETSRYSATDALSLAERLLEALAWLHSETPPVSHGAIRAEHLLEGPRNRLVLLGWSAAREGAGARPEADLRDTGLLLAHVLDGSPVHPDIEGWIEMLISEQRPDATEALRQVRELLPTSAQPPPEPEPEPAPEPEPPAEDGRVLVRILGLLAAVALVVVLLLGE